MKAEPFTVDEVIRLRARHDPPETEIARALATVENLWSLVNAQSDELVRETVRRRELEQQLFDALCNNSEARDTLGGLRNESLLQAARRVVAEGNRAMAMQELRAGRVVATHYPNRSCPTCIEATFDERCRRCGAMTERFKGGNP